jgi:hypothetical protein
MALVALLGISVLGLSGCAGQTVVEAEEQPGERYQVSVRLDPPTLNIPHLGTLTFEVQDSANLNRPVVEFQEVSGALLHHVLFSHDLEYFHHSYTDVLVDNKASVFVNFPKLGSYYSFAQFQPAGGELQTFRQTISAGPVDEHEVHLVPDTSFTRTAGWLTAQLVMEPEIRAGNPTQMVLHLSERGQPVTALTPYLNAPGHMWLVDDHGEHFAHVVGAAEGRPVIQEDQATTEPTGTPLAGGTRTPRTTGTPAGEEPPTTSGSTTGGTGAAGSGQAGTRSGGPGTPSVEGEPLAIGRPTFMPAISAALATVTAAPQATLAVAQQTAQAYLAATPETGADYQFGPEVAFTHTFAEAGVYKLWFEVQHSGQVALVSFVIEVHE